MVSHAYVVDKKWERYLKSKGSQTQPRPPSPGPQHHEDKFPYLQAVKASGGWGSRRNCQVFRKLHLKGPHGLKMSANLATLGFRAAAGRVPLVCGEWVK